ncbi:cupin domain-containing protein [Tepidamorphus sp. 3E244]|uniref:cupin domain-containing protein n=1 Tax=Tepidamorphus sp. 3E244 TaxID=3385498 RepID=UPI0038FC50A0
MTAKNSTLAHALNARVLLAPACLAAGLAIGFASATGNAATPAEAPIEHKGLAVEKLGVLEEGTLKATTGLEGYFMQLRAITIDPGGQIAKHDHKVRPGLVKVIDGEWVEGRPDGETTDAPGDGEGILEDENTVHWFFNRGDKPATAIVCDLTPAS